MRCIALLAGLSLCVGEVNEHDLLNNQLAQALQEHRVGFQLSDRWAYMRHQVSIARLRRELLESSGAVRPFVSERPQFACPPAGAGVPERFATEIEEHHYQRHKMWAEDQDLCHRSFGLWTHGGSESCVVRPLVIGSMVGLSPGDLVLDVGSACGHMARWFYDWFGARTLGLDFQRAATAFASTWVSPKAPTQFCWLDVSSQLGPWLPNRSVKLATAISVLEYLRSDAERWEAGPEPCPNCGVQNVTRTACHQLHLTHKTQCRVAWEMFRATAVGGHTWIAHNGVYKGKWDPKRVWGQRYWKCCFHGELKRKELLLREVPEEDLFMSGEGWDQTYSLVLKRLA